MFYPVWCLVFIYQQALLSVMSMLNKRRFGSHISYCSAHFELSRHQKSAICSSCVLFPTYVGRRRLSQFRTYQNVYTGISYKTRSSRRGARSRWMITETTDSSPPMYLHNSQWLATGRLSNPTLLHFSPSSSMSATLVVVECCHIQKIFTSEHQSSQLCGTSYCNTNIFARPARSFHFISTATQARSGVNNLRHLVS